VQCYAPTEDAENDQKSEFYEQLTRTLYDIKKSDIVILMGDFNAKIGKNNNGYSQIMGKQGCGVKNNNGERLIDLCQTFQLVIGGSLFPHKNIHKYTWTSPNGQVRNQIDHICISKKWRRSLLDVRNKRGADIDSDHELLISRIKIKLKRKFTQHAQHRYNRYNLHALRHPETRNEVTNALRERLPPNQEYSWDHIANTLKRVADQTLGVTHPTRKTWISNETWNLITERNEVKMQLVSNANAELKEKYLQVAKQVKRAARRDKRNFIEKVAESAEEYACQHNLRGLHNTIKQLTGHKGSHRNQAVTDKKGVLLTNNDDQLKRWKEHFQEASNIELHEETNTGKQQH